MPKDRTEPRGPSSRRAILTALVGVSIALAGCVAHRAAPGLTAPRLDEEPREVEAEVLASHNRERAARGRSPIQLDPALTRAAQGQADDMAGRGRMGHRGGDGSSPFDRIERAGFAYRAAGENVAAGFRTVPDVMAGWMRSRGHRANILGDFDRIGVGRAVAPDGSTYWCVTFGTPRAAISRAD